MASRSKTTQTLGPFEVPALLKKAYKAYCAGKSVSMTKDIITLIGTRVRKPDPVPEPAAVPAQTDDKLVGTPENTGTQ